jgi:hypothetical protein
VDHTLRLYNNPLKQALYLVAMLGFVAAGVLMVRDSRTTAVWLHVAFACFWIGVFGLGAVVFGYALARNLFLRRPLLQVDAQGWTYESPLGRVSVHMSWQEIDGVALCRSRTTRFAWTYNLVLQVEDQEPLPDASAPRVNAGLLSVWDVQLNFVFLRPTSASATRLLHAIQAEFAGELRQYCVTVDETIHQM